MKTAEEIFQILKEKFPAEVISFSNTQFEPFILIEPLAVNKIALFLRDEPDLYFDSLMVLSGVDDANGEKKQNEDGSYTIVGGTLSVYYHLHSIKINHKVTIKASTPRENPDIESVEPIWKCANWHEREVYDMYGVKFLHHPDLRRILMPYDWEDGYYPLRKDYKNPEFYQGMKIAY